MDANYLALYESVGLARQPQLRHVRKTLGVLVGCILASFQSAHADDLLPIPPVVQQTEVWCWAAVSEMALVYYEYDSINPAGQFQCGVVALLGGVCNTNCFSCVTGIGTLPNLVLALQAYQQIAQRLGAAGYSFNSHVGGPLSPAQIRTEIDDGDPIIAGINPSGMGRFYPPGIGEHVALIIGYASPGRTFKLVVNDPYPYVYAGYDPYLNWGAIMIEPGQYLINYETFLTKLIYKDSIYFSS